MNGNPIRGAMFGLGSRAIIIAKAIALDKLPTVDWIVNEQCPFGYQLVFPNGIPGVEISDSKPAGRFGYLWPQQASPRALRPAVARVFAAMEIPDPEPLELGVLFRGWRGEPFDFFQFLHEIHFAAMDSTGPIAVLADSRREEIAEALGDRALAQESPPMDHDLDRSAEGIRGYLAEWKRLLACRRIVANCQDSSILWPRQFLQFA